MWSTEKKNKKKGKPKKNAEITSNNTSKKIN